MKKIYLIGTQHFDILGASKLEKALIQLSPALILVEGSKANTDSASQYDTVLEEELKIRNVNGDLKNAVLAKQHRIRYETRVPSTYALRQEIIFDYLNDELPVFDDNQNREYARKEVDDLIRKNISLQLFNDYFLQRQKRIEDDLAYLKKTIGTSQEIIDSDFNISHSSQIGRRDITMTNTLRGHYFNGNRFPIITVTGFMHILNDPKNRNFFGRIRNLQPERVFLY